MIYSGDVMLCGSIIYRFLAKILVPEGSKDVPVGQPIAITVYVQYTSSISYSFVMPMSCVQITVLPFFTQSYYIFKYETVD